MKFEQNKILDLVIVGSGLSSLNFIDSYLSNQSNKKKKIHIISPNFQNELNEVEENNINFLPSQMKEKKIFVKNFFFSNNLIIHKSCNIIGSLNSGGLSNYWGLQIDNYFFNDQKELKKKKFTEIENEFVSFLEKYKLFGSFYSKKKIVYKNDYKTSFDKFLNIKNSYFNFEKPILGFFSNKKNKSNLNKINENKERLVPKNFIKKSKIKDKIISYNFYVDKIIKKKELIEITLKNKNEIKIILCKKIVFAAGTLATTKILMNYLNINYPVRIKHHPRMFALFISRKKINSNLDFTPSLLQIINTSRKKKFAADLRPGNKQIIDSMTEAFPFLFPIKFILNFFRKRMLFSNILYSPSISNLFIKKRNNEFILFSKKNKNIKQKLLFASKKIFKFLKNSKIIFSLYNTHFPGAGSDYHYFGSIPFGKGKLAVNNNCQLLGNKNIYIIDSSIFSFETNKYPLGLVIANARRIGKLLSK